MLCKCTPILIHVVYQRFSQTFYNSFTLDSSCVILLTLREEAVVVAFDFKVALDLAFRDGEDRVAVSLFEHKWHNVAPNVFGQQTFFTNSHIL